MGKRLDCTVSVDGDSEVFPLVDYGSYVVNNNDFGLIFVIRIKKIIVLTKTAMLRKVRKG